MEAGGWPRAGSWNPSGVRKTISLWKEAEEAVEKWSHTRRIDQISKYIKDNGSRLSHYKRREGQIWKGRKLK